MPLLELVIRTTDDLTLSTIAGHWIELGADSSVFILEVFSSISEEVIFFENEGHGFKNIENKEKVIQKSHEFLKNALSI